MTDSTNVADLPNVGSAYAGYVGGNYHTWPALIARFPNTPCLSIAINASEMAQCLDVEKGDATPAQVPGWLDRHAKERPGEVAVIYTSASQVHDVRAAAGRRRYLLWTAHYTGSSHLCSPGACGYPLADATQFTNHGPHSGHYDMSVMTPAFLAAISHRGATSTHPKEQSMVTAADVVRVAESQVGYHEGYLVNGHYHVGPPWDNIQKYSPAVPGLEWSQGQAYCCTGVSWVALTAGAAALFPRTASVAAARDWWKAHGRFDRNPRIGDQVIFGQNGDAHTAVVVAVGPYRIHTVEFNSNNNGSAQGDGVYALSHDRNDPWIYGYGHPKYAQAKPTAAQRPVPAVSLYTARKAARHNWRLTSVVRWRQITRIKAALKAENCPTYTAWQLHLGLKGKDADGIPGLDSLTKLGRRHGFRVTTP